MSIDPANGFPTTAESRVHARLAAIERRLDAIQGGSPTIQVVDGAPVTAPRDGTPAVDSVAVRLYLRVNGSWRYTALT